MGSHSFRFRSLAAAVAWIEQADRQGFDDLRGTRPAWGRWDERVVFPILRREAEALVRGNRAGPKTDRRGMTLIDRCPHDDAGRRLLRFTMLSGMRQQSGRFDASLRQN